MVAGGEHAIGNDFPATLDRLAADEAAQSNCLFQLALMLARVALEPCSEAYKEDAAQTVIGLIRAKPKSNVVRLFGHRSQSNVAPMTARAAR